MKGITITQLQTAGIAILVLAVVVAIGSQVISEMQSAMGTTANTQTDNRTLTAGVTAQQVGGFGSNPTNFVGLHVWNGTALVLGSGNWTLSTSGIFNLSIETFENDTALTLTFTNDHDVADTAYNTTVEGLNAMSEFADWFTIIVIVLVAVVIIALLIRGLGGTTSGA